jgi:LPS export ABC transporter protein LptC
MQSLKNRGLLFLLMAFYFAFTSCETNRDEIMALGKKVVMPSLTGKDITMLYSDSTILKMKLQTPQMQKYEKDVKEPITIMPKGLFVTFYDNKGKESTTLKADYGVRYEISKRMEVKYNVEVVNVNGEKLNTEHLIWDEQKKKITSDAFVKITTAKEIIMGKGLEANQDFTQYEIKEVTGTIRVEDNKL